jgi:hypothetical protein
VVGEAAPTSPKGSGLCCPFTSPAGNSGEHSTPCQTPPQNPPTPPPLQLPPSLLGVGRVAHLLAGELGAYGHSPQALNDALAGGALVGVGWGFCGGGVGPRFGGLRGVKGRPKPDRFRSFGGVQGFAPNTDRIIQTRRHPKAPQKPTK